MDTTFRRKYEKLQLAKLLEEPFVAIEKDGKVLDICHKNVTVLRLFLKKGGNVHCIATITAVQFFSGLFVQCV